MSYVHSRYVLGEGDKYIPDLVTTQHSGLYYIYNWVVLTAMLCEHIASNPSLVRPQTLDPGALSLSQPPGQGRVGVRLVVSQLRMMKVWRPPPSSHLLPLLSTHPLKI